jgi:hypothetical protein
VDLVLHRIGGNKLSNRDTAQRDLNGFRFATFFSKALRAVLASKAPTVITFPPLYWASGLLV